MTPVDLLDLPALSAPRLSPDGRRVLYLRETSDWRADRRIDQLWLADRAEPQPVQLTRGATGVADPSWSPDGSLIAFRAEREGDRADQIYLLRAAGGEVRRLTTAPRGAGDYRWSPDGRSIYFLALDPEPKLEPGRLRPADVTTSHRHLWRVDVASGAATRLTQGAFSVRDIAPSDDGRTIVHIRDPGRGVDDRHLGEVWLMDAGGGNARRVTRNTYAEDDPALSPDGRTIAYQAAVNAAGEPYHNERVFVVPAVGGTPRPLGVDAEHEVVTSRWADDGTIYALANMGVRNELFALSVESGRARRLTDGEHTLRDWDYDRARRTHVFLRRTPTDPGDVWTMAGDRSATMRRVTREFADLEKRFLLPRQEAVRWTGADGVEVEGILTYPVGYADGTRHPLVVISHGGPRSSVQYGPWIWSQHQPVMAGLGYAVLLPNYRGSTGYGDAFLRGQVGGFFGQADQDVLRGVDAMVARGIADPDRLAAMGWSAGGRMTNKLITLTDRFKAASTGAGTVEFVSGYGSNDTRYLQTYWYGAPPWVKGAPVERYLEQSPLFDLWRVKTPTLIFTGAEDKRVVPEQSYMLHRALDDLGVPTRLYVAPGEGHNFRRLSHRLFKINAELDWFERHVRGREHQWSVAPQLERPSDPP